MNNTTPEAYFLPRWLRSWEQFWFTPADPTLLGVMRVTAGLIVAYTLAVYGINLQDFMGENAWHDMKLRDQLRYERPVHYGTWSWTAYGKLPMPKTDWEREYFNRYRERWQRDPLPPYPANEEEAKFLDDFMEKYHIDLRSTGLTPPQNEFQRLYADVYTLRWKVPPPAYAKDEVEAEEIARYMEEFNGNDPRRLYSKGMPVWSLWYHVVDPGTMAGLHWLIVFCALLFTIGFCTRLTAGLTWFASLCYIHRNPTNLFGVDTMMTIVLLYLTIGPSGAVFSVDALIRRWWVRAKPGVVQAWCRFWKRPTPEAIAPAAPAEPAPSVAANVAIRLLQVHLCIIYLMAGLSKLQGQAWWDGGALWLTLGNYEFAPMQFELYMKFVRLLGSHQWLYNAFMTGGGLFTLAFEIGFAFLIWRPKLRWVFLGGAILLHGVIGLFMGLKTFSLIMLVMNMAFLRKEEVLWFLSWFRRPASAAQPASGPPEPMLAGSKKK